MNQLDFYDKATGTHIWYGKGVDGYRYNIYDINSGKIVGYGTTNDKRFIFINKNSEEPLAEGLISGTTVEVVYKKKS